MKFLEYLNEELRDSVSFFEKPDGQHYAGEADLSKIDNDILQSNVKFKIDGIWFYFNRLIVPKQLRGHGLSKKLLQRVANWADENKVNIWNDINPYGDLNLKQLIELYSQFGFKKIMKSTMVRLHK
jgi:GNAT superfamily N-acetyltransferase